MDAKHTPSTECEPERVVCSNCAGRGFYGGDGFSEDTVDCPACGGSGEVVSPRAIPASKHTPRPWIVCECSDNDAILSIEQDRRAISEEPAIIGEIDLEGEGIDREVGTANAYLVATAPDGLALAEHILAMADDACLVGHPEWHEMVAEAKALKDKAEGR